MLNCMINHLTTDESADDKSPNYIWSDESAVKFQSALLSPDIQTKLKILIKFVLVDLNILWIQHQWSYQILC